MGTSYVLVEDVELSENASSKHRGSKATLFSISANLVMSGLGAGILSLPWAMAGASVVPSIITILVVMALNAATIMILVHAAEKHQAFDLGALLGQLPGGIGPGLQVFNNVLTWVSIFLTLVGYIVVMADALEPFIGPVVSSSIGKDQNSHFWLIRVPIIALSGIMVLPICFVDQQRLAVSSIVGICVVVYIFIVVATVFAREGVAPECCVASGVHSGTVTMFSTLMQCAIIQMCILPMYEELDNRSPRRFSIAVLGAFGFLAILFAAFSAVAYIVFGPSVHSNVMTDLPHDTLGDVARVGMTLVMLAVFPIMSLAMVAPVRHWEESSGRTNNYVSLATSVCIVLASSFGAAFVGELGALNAMNGSMQVSCFIGLAPGLVGLYLLRQDGALWRVSMYALIIASLVISVLGGIYTDNAVELIEDNCFWST